MPWLGRVLSAILQPHESQKMAVPQKPKVNKLLQLWNRSGLGQVRLGAKSNQIKVELEVEVEVEARSDWNWVESGNLERNDK